MFFVSCIKSNECNKSNEGNKEEITTPSEEVSKGKVTIMIYGCGGGNLDADEDKTFMGTFNGLRELGLLGDEVNVTVEYKYSALANNSKYSGLLGRPSTVYRYKMDPDASYPSNASVPISDECIFAGWDFDMSTAEHLQDFIEYSVEAAPAEKYVLILENHGGGYLPYNEVLDYPTKVVMYDDNIKKVRAYFNDKALYYDANMPLTAIRDGIAEVKNNYPDFNLDVLDFNLCLCNMLEIVGEFKGVADFVVACEHPSLSVYDNNVVLAESLLKYDTEEALREFGDHFVSKMSNSGYPVDVCITKTSEIDKVYDVVKQLAEFLCEKQENADEDTSILLNQAVCSCYQVYDGCPYFDFGDFLFCVSVLFDDAPISLKDFTDAQSAALVGSYNNEINWNEKVFAQSWSVTIIKEAVYDILYQSGEKLVFNWDGSAAYYPNYKLDEHLEGHWMSTGEKTYEQLYFDKYTGWSNWLKVNKFAPTGNPTSGVDYDSYLADADDDEIGFDSDSE